MQQQQKYSVYTYMYDRIMEGIIFSTEFIYMYNYHSHISMCV